MKLGIFHGAIPPPRSNTCPLSSLTGCLSNVCTPVTIPAFTGGGIAAVGGKRVSHRWLAFRRRSPIQQLHPTSPMERAVLRC